MTAADPPTLVLLPGFMTDRALWSRMEPGLTALAPCHFADLSGITGLADAARDVLAAVPGPVVPIGFSMGGFVAREMAHLAPDRAKGLVLMNTSARPSRPEIQARNAALVDNTRKRGYRGLSPIAVKKALHPNLRDDAALVGEILDMAKRMGGDAFINQLSVARRDGRPDLPNIACPTLVIWSRQDELRSLRESEEMAEGIPGGRLEIIENAGHMTPMETPAEVLRLLTAFLNGLG